MLLPLLLVAPLQSAAAAPGAGTLTWQSAPTAAAPQAGDQFGSALAAGGERLIVGAWRRDGNTGGADVLRWTGDGFVHEGSLVPPAGSDGDMCGFQVHLDGSGSLACLAATGDGVNGPNAGAVHLYRRSGATWSFEATLRAPDGAEADRFGAAVALGDGFVVVGAPGVDVAPFHYGAGAVYVFEPGPLGWGARPRIVLPPDQIDIGDGFGAVLDADGDAFAVGAPAKDTARGDNSGAAYVVQRAGPDWLLSEPLLPADAAQGSAFGRALALDGGALAVASLVPSAATMSGTVHVFASNVASGWVEWERVTAPGPRAYDEFGGTLALHDGMLLASSRLGRQAGVTRVFAHHLGRGGALRTQTLSQPLPQGAHVFVNSAVALGDGFAVVGESGNSASLAGTHGFVEAYGRAAAGAASARR